MRKKISVRLETLIEVEVEHDEDGVGTITKVYGRCMTQMTPGPRELEEALDADSSLFELDLESMQ